jgi:hypothetical protein
MCTTDDGLCQKPARLKDDKRLGCDVPFAPVSDLFGWDLWKVTQA